jgi:hypothetical protein
MAACPPRGRCLAAQRWLTGMYKAWREGGGLAKSLNHLTNFDYKDTLLDHVIQIVPLLGIVFLLKPLDGYYRILWFITFPIIMIP